MFLSLLKGRMVQSLLRHTITGAGTLLVSKGILEPEMASQLSTTVAGMVLGGVGLVWSGKDKKETEPKKPVVTQPETVEPVYYEDDSSALSDTITISWDGTPTGFTQLMQDNPYLKPKVYANYVDKTPQPEPVRSEPEKAKKSTGFMLSSRSREAMVGVHPLMTKVVETALELTDIDFAVTEGVRSEQRQKELVQAGKSWVKKSKHQDGYAVDVAAFPSGYSECSWELADYAVINKAFQAAAKIHNVRVTWGGHWAVKDGVHFQLDSETVKPKS